MSSAEEHRAGGFAYSGQPSFRITSSLILIAAKAGYLRVAEELEGSAPDLVQATSADPSQQADFAASTSGLTFSTKSATVMVPVAVSAASGPAEPSPRGGRTIRPARWLL